MFRISPLSLIKLYLNSDKLHLKSNRLMQKITPGGFSNYVGSVTASSRNTVHVVAGV